MFTIKSMVTQRTTLLGLISSVPMRIARLNAMWLSGQRMSYRLMQILSISISQETSISKPMLFLDSSSTKRTNPRNSRKQKSRILKEQTSTTISQRSTTMFKTSERKIRVANSMIRETSSIKAEEATIREAEETDNMIIELKEAIKGSITQIKRARMNLDKEKKARNSKLRQIRLL